MAVITTSWVLWLRVEMPDELSIPPFDINSSPRPYSLQVIEGEALSIFLWSEK